MKIIIISFMAVFAFSTYGNAMNCEQLKALIPDAYECPVSGECIFKEWVCDSKPDCVDKSDEDTEKCAAQWQKSCSNDFIRHPFRCDNGMCVPESNECNGVEDCLDGSDEKNCANNDESYSSSSAESV